MIQIVSKELNIDQVTQFLKSLNDSELSNKQHHCDDVRIKPSRIGLYVIIVSFKEHCGFLVKKSFDDGILSDFKEDFIINNH